MHETPSSPDNNNESELFRQLADLGTDEINESLNYELEEIAEIQDSLHNQQQVIQRLKGRHPVFAEFLEPFTPEAQIELYDSVIELRNWLSIQPPLPDDLEYRVQFSDSLYTHVWRIADILSGIGEKAETQVRIIIDDILPAELKTILLEVLGELIPEGGINTSDPQEVQTAINHHQAREKNAELRKALRVQITELIRTHAHELIHRYKIHPEDPVWSEICAWTCTNLVLRTTLGKDTHDVFSFNIREHLTILRISEADYLALVTKVEEMIEN